MFKNIGRKTIYGNPVKMKRTCPVCQQIHMLPVDTLDCYARYLHWRMSPGKESGAQQMAKNAGMPGWPEPAMAFRAKLLLLDDKHLYCPGCGEGSPTCHGRILERAIAWLLLPP